MLMRTKVDVDCMYVKPLIPAELIFTTLFIYTHHFPCSKCDKVPSMQKKFPTNLLCTIQRGSACYQSCPLFPPH